MEAGGPQLTVLFGLLGCWVLYEEKTWSFLEERVVVGVVRSHRRGVVGARLGPEWGGSLHRNRPAHLDSVPSCSCPHCAP